MGRPARPLRDHENIAPSSEDPIVKLLAVAA
jgi:hypothetical protein